VVAASGASYKRRQREYDIQLNLTPTESTFFDKVREACGAARESRDPWSEFLKCLELYSCEVLSKAELMSVEMRRSRKRELIASKRALRNPQTTEDQPVCAMCGGRKEDALIV
jgi:histone deacetylase complex regulatory component SIN3